ncbi:hypothetical protein [Mycolicibacterium mengxianglii]|uniref:hypothetical protein n=1 Tax=Mycolicibacterium mengxianglii TaxID=2736649 RepID=UPI0018D1E5F0|nr:hypothetical protein [Mycolicibacterium mengxianglii]
MPDSRRTLAELPPKSSAVAWKLVVAVEGPWVGEIYRTRPGRDRHQFTNMESFCVALLSVTGWTLDVCSPAAAAGSAATAGGDDGARAGNRRRASDTISARGKFIVAADEPWGGEMYRTRPGLGRFHFTSFEQMLRSVVGITGWPLESSARREDVAPGAGFSRPA